MQNLLLPAPYLGTPLPARLRSHDGHGGGYTLRTVSTIDTGIRCKSTSGTDFLARLVDSIPLAAKIKSHHDIALGRIVGITHQQEEKEQRRPDF